MADATATLAIELETGAFKANADSAAAALDAMKASVQVDQAELKSLQAQMAVMKGQDVIDPNKFFTLDAAIDGATQKVNASKAAFAAQAVEVAKMNASMATAKAGMASEAASATALAASEQKATQAGEQLAASGAHIGKALGDASKATAKGADAFKDGTLAASGMLGPMGGVFERVNKLKSAFSGGGGWEGAIVMATAAVVALSAAVVIGIGYLAMYAVTLNKVAMEKLSKATEKAKANLGKLFSGVNVDKFVKAYEEVLSLLDESSSSAKAVKDILSIMLNPLFDAAAYVGPFVKNMFRGMVIGALLLAIGILTLRNAIKSLIPAEALATISEFGSKINWVWVAVGIGVAAIAVVTVLLVALSAVLLVCAAASFVALLPLMLLVAAFLILVAVLLAPVIAIVLLITYFDQLVAALGGLVTAGVDAAAGLISGLVNGITSGGAAVIAAVMGLAGSAKSALMSALGIASPSKVFASLGKHTAAGFAEGVDAGAASVDASVSGMVNVPAAAPQKGGSAGKSGGGNVYNVTVNGVSGADEMTTAAFVRKVAEAIEFAADQGGVPMPEPA